MPYRFVLSHEQVPERAVARRYIEGTGRVDRPNWRIETDRETHIPEVDNDGWLRTDYLLVTRLRNFLTAEGFAQGHSVVSIAGTHGVGTQALGLLLRDRQALRAIAAATQGHPSPSFQALLRVTEIDHDKRKGSRARRMELVSDPVLIGDEPAEMGDCPSGRQATRYRLDKQSPEEWRPVTDDVVGAGDRWIPEDEYRLILARVPIACVDLLPLSADASPRVGLIFRETVGGGHGWCLVGGSVLRNEPIAVAVRRHLAATLGASVALRPESLRYATTIEYFSQAGIGDFHDPRKHAIAHTFAGVCSGSPEPAGEAETFAWFAVDRLPPAGEFGFGQDRVVKQVLHTLGLS